MSFRSFAAAVMAALIVVLPATPAVAGGPPATVPAMVSGGQEAVAVRVLVAQSEIKSNAVPSLLAVATGGGILGGLMAAAQNASREKKAEQLIAPIRTALVDLDTDALALKAARDGLAGVSWLSAAPVTFGKDNSPVGESAFLDAGTAANTVFIDYTYDLSPGFDAVRVVANFSIANKAIPANSSGAAGKPEDRVKSRYLRWSQAITSVVYLPGANPDDKDANIPLLAAANGDLVRRGLAQAFTQVAALTPKAFALTEAEIKAMGDKTRPKFAYQTLSGRVVDQSGGGTVFWARQFVTVQQLQ